jgi:hypothetical protein
MSRSTLLQDDFVVLAQKAQEMAEDQKKPNFFLVLADEIRFSQVGDALTSEDRDGNVTVIDPTPFMNYDLSINSWTGGLNLIDGESAHLIIANRIIIEEPTRMSLTWRRFESATFPITAESLNFGGLVLIAGEIEFGERGLLAVESYYQSPLILAANNIKVPKLGEEFWAAARSRLVGNDIGDAEWNDLRNQGNPIFRSMPVGEFKVTNAEQLNSPFGGPLQVESKATGNFFCYGIDFDFNGRLIRKSSSNPQFSGSKPDYLIREEPTFPRGRLSSREDADEEMKSKRLKPIIASGKLQQSLPTSLLAKFNEPISMWKVLKLQSLSSQTAQAKLTDNNAALMDLFREVRNLPFGDIPVSDAISQEYTTLAKELRRELVEGLPGIVKEVLQDDLPGGKATLQMFGVPKKGQFRIAPHESPVVVLANSKLGTVTYDSGNESFEVSVDVELGVSPAAIKPAKQYIGKVFEYAGTQPIKVTDIGCSFPGIAGVKFNDLGSGRLKLSFVLKGDKSGLALTQFSNNIGVPITITADVEGEGDVVQFSSIYTVSLAKRNRSDVSISGGKIHNLSSRSVYVGWLAGANGEVFLPKDGRPQFVDANKEISVDQFSEAGAATKVPPAALEYVVANPLQELDFQDTNAIEKLSVTNGILPVFQQAGVDQFLSYVEVEITESWDGNTIKHGPFLLSPKNAQGSDLILPLIKHPNRKLNLSGRLVFSNGGFKNLKSQTIDGLSLLINTQMIE